MTGRVDLSRFLDLPRHRAERLAAASPRVVDLASTFPLLFLMLACDCGPARRRKEALRLARLGEPLAEVAEAMALPLCLRRLPPEACRTPLAWAEWSPEAGSQLGNHIPASATQAASWLAAIFYARQACSEAFGLWIARQRRLFAEPLDGRLLRPLALYAWHSRDSGNPLSRLAAEPWSPEQGIRSAVAETGGWLARLKLAVHCGGHPIADTWLSPGRVAGLDFVALATWDDIMAERAAMRNCLHTYLDKVASGACRLFSVRSNGMSLATLELAPGKDGVPGIVQLKGPGNSTPAPEVQSAARAWLASQSDRRPLPQPRGVPREDAVATLQRLLMPYFEATSAPDKRRRGTWNFRALEQQLQYLTACVGPQPKSVPPARNRPAGRPAARMRPPRTPESARVQAALCERLGDEVYQSWFRALEVEAFDGETVHVSVPVTFIKRWIEAHYRADVLACCAHVFDGARHVEVTLRRPDLPHPAARPAAPVVRPAPAARRQGSSLAPRATFESFVVGPTNRMAHVAAMCVAEQAAAAERMFNPLYLHSAAGLGKTHLLNATAWQARWHNPATRVLHVTGECFRRQLADAMATNAVASFQDRCCALDLLIVDDFEYVVGDRVVPVLEHILGRLLDMGRQVVLSSSRPPAELDGLSERMRMRLQYGLVTEIAPMDAAMRCVLLGRRIQERRAADPAFAVPRRVLVLLADRLEGGGHELQGAANQLYLVWQLTRVPPTREIAERIAAGLRG
jgi:chromosomal replication initiator protein